MQANRMFPESCKAFESDAVRQQLSRILTSPDFSVPRRLQDFLVFIVEERLAGRGRIKAYTIATQVFGRRDDFDVLNDPVVRIEARRLRRALERYYLLAGREDPIIIDIPKGTYLPTITERPINEAPEAMTAVFRPPEALETPPPKRRGWTSKLGLPGTAVIAVFIAGAFAHRLITGFVNSPDRTSSPEVTLIVSPFDNLSGSDAAIYAGGISDELVNQLARFRELKLLSGATNKAISLQSTGARYFLEGSVRVAEQRLRVSSRLLAGSTKEVVWSTTYDRDLRGSQNFDIESDIANRVAAAVAQPYGAIFAPVSRDASARIPAGAEAYSCILRFYHYRNEPTREEHRETRECLKGTLIQSPHYSTGWAMLAYLYLDEDRLDFNPQAPAPAGKARAREAAERAVRLDPKNVRALQALMAVLFYSKEPDAALKLGESALALNPNDTEILAELGSRLAQIGDRERGLMMIEEAIERNPQQTKYYTAILAQNYYLSGNNERALYWIRRANMQKFANYHFVAALIFARAHLEQETKASVQEFMRMRPHFIENIEAEIAVRNYNASDRLLLLEGARQAGFPVGPAIR